MSATSAPRRPPRWRRSVVHVLAALVIAFLPQRSTDRSSLRDWHFEWTRQDGPDPRRPWSDTTAEGDRPGPGPQTRRGRRRRPNGLMIARAVHCSCRSRTP